MARRFRDRRDAGRALAAALGTRVDPPVLGPDALVLGLPRGGVPVAAEVATGLGAPLDVFVVRKLGVPGHEELAMGAVAGGGITVRNEGVIAAAGIDEAAFRAVEERERIEVERRERRYRGGRVAPVLAGVTVVLVDDGLATGSTMRAAIEAARRATAAAVVVAVPTGAPRTCAELGALLEGLVCLAAPRGFYAVGQAYDDFSPTRDEEVEQILARRDPQGRLPPPARAP
ncbi:MAG: phosphoribosyltransferase [Actinomycetota bacterium]